MSRGVPAIRSIPRTSMNASSMERRSTAGEIAEHVEGGVAGVAYA